MFSLRCFEIAAPKTLENIQKMYVVKFIFHKLHGYSLQPTTGLKPPLQILFWKYSERKECSKDSKIPRKSLQVFLFFPDVAGLQSTISYLTKTDSKKNVSCECFKMVGNLPGKGPYCSHFIKVTGLLSRIYRLLKKVNQNSVMWTAMF